jgi:recombination protein RecA
MATKTREKKETSKSASNADILTMINKRMGEGSIYTFEGEQTAKVQPVSTGIPSLDHALGIGGWPWGRLVELYGPESSGKTTIALRTIAEFQKHARTMGHVFYGKKAVFIDAEHALDPFHAQALGVDISEETGMLIAQPESGEAAYDLMVALILSGHIGLITGDSLPSFIPKKVIDGSAEDNHIGLQARLNSQMLPIVANHAQKHDCLVIMINQIREKVGVMYGNQLNV